MQRLVFIAVLALWCAATASATCEIIAGGYVFSLDSVYRESGYTSVNPRFMFRYQPCGSCTGSCVSGVFAKCPNPGAPGYQIELQNKDACHTIGEADNGKAVVRGETLDGGIMCNADMCLAYKGGSPCTGNVDRNFIFMFTCTELEEEPQPVLEVDVCQYAVNWRSPAGCKRGKANTGLSRGSIFDILFFVGFGVYFGGGYLYRSKKLGFAGAEAIPNVEFWRSLPALVKDGCIYFWGILPVKLTAPVDKLLARGGGYTAVSS